MVTIWTERYAHVCTYMYIHELQSHDALAAVSEEEPGALAATALLQLFQLLHQLGLILAQLLGDCHPHMHLDTRKQHNHPI